jgi:hypothetical protein
MTPPQFTKTFYKVSPIAIELKNELGRYDKSFDDIKYVSYVVFNPTNTSMNNYHCSILEFLSATVHVASVHELNWPCEIIIVGKGFWLDYDINCCWRMHVPPVMPINYRKPVARDFIKDRI